jgi:hypothetical protein
VATLQDSHRKARPALEAEQMPGCLIWIEGAPLSIDSDDRDTPAVIHLEHPFATDAGVQVSPGCEQSGLIANNLDREVVAQF